MTVNFGPVDCRHQGLPELVLDIECGVNFYMVGCRWPDGRTAIFTSRNGLPMVDEKLAELNKIVSTHTVVGFNVAQFDRLILSAILAGGDPQLCHSVAQTIIVGVPSEETENEW